MKHIVLYFYNQIYDRFIIQQKSVFIGSQDNRICVDKHQNNFYCSGFM